MNGFSVDMATGETIAFSLAGGLLLFLAACLTGLFSTQASQSATVFLWIFLPIFGYLSSFGILSALNYTSCGSISIPIVARSAIFTVAAVIGFLLLSSLEFFRNFIIPALPYTLQESIGPTLAVAFYMFWAGMYGTAFGAGFASSCGKPS